MGPNRARAILFQEHGKCHALLRTGTRESNKYQDGAVLVSTGQYIVICFLLGAILASVWLK